MTRSHRPRAVSSRVTRVTFQMLSEGPERASIETLRTVLDITSVALLAANPDLLDDGWPSMPERGHLAVVRIASRILRRGDALRTELKRYTDLLDSLHEPGSLPDDDGFPF